MYIKSYRVLWCLLLLALRLSKCETNGIVTRFDSADIDDSDANVFPSGEVCGMDNTNNVIDHTWLARLRYQNDVYGCGGVVLNGRYILTAASCLIGDIVQHLGELKNVTLFENSGDRLSKDYYVEETVIHSKFVPNDIHGDNDVALIRLTKRILKSTPICTDGNKPFDEALVPHVEGWGQTYAGQKTSSRKTLNLKYINTTACHNLLSPYSYDVTALDVCVTLDEHDYNSPCSVDGGGILINRVESRWRLVGIGSYNAVCGYHERPGVFTKFYKIFSWIEDNIRA